LPAEAKADLAAGKPLVIRLLVPKDAKNPGGLSVYGANTGAYPFDPTLVLHTEGDLPADLGVKPDEPIVVDTSATRQTSILTPGDAPRATPATWRFTTTEPGPDWTDVKFDASGWERGASGFGAAETPAVAVKTTWKSPAIWLRTVVESPKLGPNDTLVLHLFHDEDCEIFVNGKPLFHARGYVSSYRDVELNESQKALFAPGANTIAVSCKQTGGGQGIDVGLKLIKSE
jgi:hypothetical protein